MRRHTVARVQAVDFFLFEHAHVHARAVAPSTILNLEDLLCDGLAEGTLRCRPDEHTNPIVWLLWHMARSEDVGINVMLAGGHQVFDAGDWAEPMKVPDRDIGTGMTKSEVAAMSDRADTAAVRAYRQAVGAQTRRVVADLDFASFDAVLPADRLRSATAGGALRPAASWVEGFWSDQPLQFFLWLGTGHNYMHLQEGFVARDRCGSGLGL
jgi:hypothetical protein